LLLKLHYYGIQGTTANQFRSYLTENKKSEINLSNEIQKFFSKWETVKHMHEWVSVCICECDEMGAMCKEVNYDQKHLIRIVYPRLEFQLDTSQM
jgi:hypothetical protein